MRILLLFSILIFNHNIARAESISLLDALKEAQAVSPELQAARFKELAAGENITAARSAYLPNFDLSFIASNGRPGASSMMGVDGNIGASQRVGAGGALVMNEVLWDFGRTGSAVEIAKSHLELRKNEAAFSTAQLGIQVLQTYFYCAYLKREIVDSKFMARQAKVIADETNKFVHSGQRSVIERYLVDSEEKEQETRIAELSTRIESVEKRLAIQLGRSDAALPECGEFESQEHELQVLEQGEEKNPIIEMRNAELQVAKQELSHAKSAAMPLLMASANGGYFENNTIYDHKLNYSIGVGLTIPLFTGFRIDANTKRSSAELQSAESTLKSAQQKVADSNSQYDEQIKAINVRIQFLDKESALAQEGFELAWKRYFGFQGNMLDLREALRNLDRIHLAIAEAQKDLFVARGARAIFNGVKVL